MYSEVDGKERIIAGDFQASRILEKLLQSSTDFHIRVFMDRLSGGFDELVQHQFASHVCQNLLILGADVAERELKGESVVEMAEDGTDKASELPTMETLIINLCQVGYF